MSSSTQRSWLMVAVIAGLVAGAMDIAGAMITASFKDIGPVRVLQSVASGLLGRDAYSGGAATAVLGLVLHFAIMQVISCLYVLVAQHAAFLRNQPMLFGPLYGVAVYFFMKSVVLPLSAFPGKGSYALSVIAVGVIVHVLCVGMPIALLARKSST